MESCNPDVRSGSTKCSVAPLSTSMVTLSPPDQKIPGIRAVDATNAPKIPPGVPLIFWDSFVGADPTCAGGVAGPAGFPADSEVGAAVVVAAACAPAKEVSIAQYENPKVISSVLVPVVGFVRHAHSLCWGIAKPAVLCLEEPSWQPAG